MAMGTLQYAVIGIAAACCIAFTVTDGVYMKRLTGCNTADSCKKDGQITLAMTCLLAILVLGMTSAGRYLF